MNLLLKKLLGTLNLAQIVTFVFGTGTVFLLEQYVPAGDLRSTLLALNTQLLALVLVLVRKPSDQGGSTADPQNTVNAKKGK